MLSDIDGDNSSVRGMTAIVKRSITGLNRPEFREDTRGEGAPPCIACLAPQLAKVVQVVKRFFRLDVRGGPYRRDRLSPLVLEPIHFGKNPFASAPSGRDKLDPKRT
jgi:hypothetical protein